jgi:exopolyphosphatase/guanosine-5'-triphosphate,3'-diphosphate pyrophosphatase
MRDLSTSDDRQQRSATATSPEHPCIVPRWEWRTFGRRIPLPAGSLKGDPRNATPSSDTYIVSSRSTDNVKVRGGRLEMKRLERVDDNGLELWNPVVSVPLPADSAELTAVWQAWGAWPPALDRPLALDDIVREVVTGAPWLRAVAVTKRRVPLLLSECRGEFVELQVAGERWESVAIEGEAPGRVRDALRRLGLDRHENVNSPRWLARLVITPVPCVPPTDT